MAFLTGTTWITATVDGNTCHIEKRSMSDFSMSLSCARSMSRSLPEDDQRKGLLVNALKRAGEETSPLEDLLSELQNSGVAVTTDDGHTVVSDTRSSFLLKNTL